MNDPSEGIPDSWQPYRDKDGNVVTITPEQCAAVIRAIEIVEQVREKEGKQPLLGGMDFIYQHHAEVTKSCLLGRILYEGKAPHREAPPVIMAAPTWAMVPGDVDYNEERMCSNCGYPLTHWRNAKGERKSDDFHAHSMMEECREADVEKFNASNN